MQVLTSTHPHIFTSAHQHIRTFAHSLIRIFAHLLICTSIFSCAQIVNPGGGPLDKTPPKTLHYNPDSAALNFNTKQIRISFNEFIQLKDVNNQLIISPPLKYQPDIKTKNKDLLITIDDTLRSNTTYAFNFGSSIADITEGNVLENFQYVFSTGSFIDSLSLSGTVKDAFTLSAQKGILVMLYDIYDDSVPLKKLPNYFSKTKEDGTYKINNIRAGRYKIFALKDANANYLYDSPDESIAFLDTLINIQKNSAFDLLMFKELPKKQLIKRASLVENYHIQIAFNKPVADLQLMPINFSTETENWKKEEYNKTKDTVDLWLPDFGKDTIKFIVKDNGKTLDTIERLMILKNARAGKFRLNVLTTNISNSFDPNKNLEIKFSHPIQNIDSQKVQLFIGKKSIAFTLQPDKGIPHKIIIKNKWIPDSTYRLLILPTAIKDIFGLTNDTINLSLKIRELKYYGTLKLVLDLPEQPANALLDLNDEKGNTIRENAVKTNKEFFYEYLSPMTYKLKFIYDTDNNGEWTTGNYFKHLQPEKVIFNPGTISIRSNWDMEQKWKINE